MENTKQLKTLFNNHAEYALPSYQRGYAWEKNNIGEFLDDLEYVSDDDNGIHEHFFGSILLASPDNPTDTDIKIIDGQQRITTSLLFLVCARNFFYAQKDNSTKAAEYYEKLEKIIYTTPINLDPNLNKPRLTLSKPNKNFFLSIVRRRSRVDPADIIDSSSNDSNVRLSDAYNAIYRWIDEKSNVDSTNTQSKVDIDASVKTIYNFFNTLISKFVIYPCRCRDESEAYRIFNLVNNRGTKLSDSDLIKSFLFGKLASNNDISEADLDSYDSSWNEMRQYVTSKQAANYDIDRYLYHHLLAFYSKTLDPSSDNSANLKQKHMYDLYEKLIKKHHISPQDIITNLREWSYTLNQLRNPTEVNFLQKDNVIHYLKKIKSVNAVFVYPAILAGYKHYWKSKNYKEFEALVMLCFKYHVRIKVIGTSISLGDYQNEMNKIMRYVTSGTPMVTIIDNLINEPEKYPDNEVIKANIQNLRIKSSRLAIAILEEIESQHRKTRSPYNVSIEHVMPKNLTPSWTKYIVDNNDIISNQSEAQAFHRQHCTLLGNLALLPSNINISISDKQFDKKKIEYAKHETFKMTEPLSRIPVWNGEAIIARQKILANELVSAIDLKNIIRDLKLS